MGWWSKADHKFPQALQENLHHPLDSKFRTQLEMESVFLWPTLPCNHWESFAAHQSKLLPANSTLPSECMELTHNLSGNQKNSKTYLVSKMSLYSVLSSCSLLQNLHATSYFSTWQTWFKAAPRERDKHLLFGAYLLLSCPLSTPLSCLR